jgi:hypothetical protein
MLAIPADTHVACHSPGRQARAFVRAAGGDLDPGGAGAVNVLVRTGAAGVLLRAGDSSLLVFLFLFFSS